MFEYYDKIILISLTAWKGLKNSGILSHTLKSICISTYMPQESEHYITEPSNLQNCFNEIDDIIIRTC